MHLARALGAAAVMLSAGCSTVFPRVEVADTRPPVPAPSPLAAPVAVSGGIFQAAAYRPMFEDHRARLVGDTLNVRIVEKVTATASSTSSVDKAGSLELGVSALPGINPRAFVRGTASGSSASAFEGKGATESSNDFSGTITVVVRGVLPNGHLLIAGEKQIGVNENVDVLRFSGQVDPRAIQAGNTVQSAQIANVRLEQRGRGQQSEAQRIGWLSRVFLSLAPF
ncbi:flagellar biosynthesis protein FlgH [beta proteobacterium AAP51]|nr:flagellar biosynthesis protein FlgH [beta proteobacterium AAP51]